MSNTPRTDKVWNAEWKDSDCRATAIMCLAQDMEVELNSATVEVARLRGIVPELLEKLNDDLCEENDKLRAELAAVTAERDQLRAAFDARLVDQRYYLTCYTS